jgi:hypothetical protein
MGYFTVFNPFCKNRQGLFSVTLLQIQANFVNKAVLCAHNFIQSFTFKILLVSGLSKKTLVFNYTFTTNSKALWFLIIYYIYKKLLKVVFM